MQTLLDDIELDIQELKCLMQSIAAEPESKLRIVAKRSIQQMRMRLDELQKILESGENRMEERMEERKGLQKEVQEEVQKEVTAVISEPLKEIKLEPVGTKEPEATAVVSSSSPILAERIKTVTDLRRSISLNDSFRFAREIFGGNTARMNEVIRQLGEAPSLDKAMELFFSTVNPDEGNEAVADFMELLKKYFS